jgi:Bacterial Ig domain
MTMNDRKMNNYSLMRVSTVFVLAVALVTSTLAIPFVPRTEAVSFAPPNEPTDPDPTNGSIDISIYTNLSWNHSDPDNDTVFDVYFGASSPPDKVATGIANKTYNPGVLKHSTKYFWQIVAVDDNETTNGPIWEFTTKANSPPNVPTSESPSNGSSNIAVTTTLSWVGGDPDVGDDVTYDVYFGAISNPPKVLPGNQTTTSYDPAGDLASNTTYYWRIVAWDNNKASTNGPLWHFKTRQPGPLTVTITKPLPSTLYINDGKKMDLSGNNTIVYGKITIEANVSSNTDVAYVLFYVDGKEIGNDSTEPYSVLWQPLIQFSSALTLRRTITVVAFDSSGNNASTNITVLKWRFHPLPWVLAGLALASRLILHTTVVGIFFNVQESRFSVSFYALRAHYKTVGPFQMRKGNIHFKSCSGGRLIGPSTLTKLGPFHRIAIGSFTFIGNVNAERIGLGGALFSGLLRPRTMGGGLLNLVRNLNS